MWGASNDSGHHWQKLQALISQDYLLYLLLFIPVLYNLLNTIFFSCKIYILPPLGHSCPGRRHYSPRHTFPVTHKHIASICQWLLPLHVSQRGAITNGVFKYVWMHCRRRGTPIERNLMGWGRVTKVARPPVHHSPSIFLNNLCQELSQLSVDTSRCSYIM
jgi:hypothetical protein